MTEALQTVYTILAIAWTYRVHVTGQAIGKSLLNSSARAISSGVVWPLSAFLFGWTWLAEAADNANAARAAGCEVQEEPNPWSCEYGAWKPMKEK